jgi:hypothetical protein
VLRETPCSPRADDLDAAGHVPTTTCAPSNGSSALIEEIVVLDVDDATRGGVLA